MGAARTSDLLEGLLDQDPGTLEPSGAAREPFLELHQRYRDELAELTARMAGQHAGMIRAGFLGDFNDREAELLYMTVREARPRTVVEISPLHGYSTNYILAGLYANGEGELHTYEIATSYRGVPIEQVIRGNQLPDLPQERLHLHIGDARAQAIPAADVLFVDSAHEDHFAAWLLRTQVPRSRLVLQHDIVVRERDHYAPKAWYLGPRESSFMLEALRRGGQRLFSTAAGEPYLQGRDGHLARRNQLAERSILYRGHALSPEAERLCALTLLVHQRRRDAVEGLRTQAALEPEEGLGFAERCAYGALLAEMGYMRGLFYFVGNYDSRVRPRPSHVLSSGELVYFVDYLLKAGLFVELLKLAAGVGVRCSNRRFARFVRRRLLRRTLAPAR